MRTTFIRTLAELADRYRDILLLTADLGYTVLEQFSEKHPGRFFNVGVAEQNMVGMSTGLAEAGFMPFLYSIAPFIALRPFEFIRNGPVYHNFPIRLLGVGGGLEYGSGGWTHHATEDVGVLRTLPGITIIAPADYRQARAALLRSWTLPGPIYYRLGKDEKRTVNGLDDRFEMGEVQIVREGPDAAVFVMGSVAVEVAEAADELAKLGVGITVVVVAVIQPAPTDGILEILRSFDVALTVEAHGTTGGLGSLVSEIVAEKGLGCRIVRCGVEDALGGVTGTERFLNGLHGLTSQSLVKTILFLLDDKKCISSAR